MMPAIDYKEEQRFSIWWAWLAVISLHTLFIYAIVKQVFLGQPFGSKPAPDLILVIVELFLLLLLFFLMSLKLKTRINETGIYFRFYPFHFKEKEIEWQELRDAYIREYNSLYEYGGWGIRTGNEMTGKAINTSASSNRGLQLQFTNGKRLLIGTKRPDELKRIIDAAVRSGKINRGI